MGFLGRTWFALYLSWALASCDNGSPTWTRLEGRFFSVAEYSGSSLSLMPMPERTIQLSSDLSLVDKVRRLAIRRYEGASCADRSESEGDLVSTDASQTTWLDSDLKLGTAYCYKFFIRYQTGEIFTKTLAYLGPEVISPGKIEIAGLDSRTLILNHTRSTSEAVDHVDVRRYSKASCTDEPREGGESLTIGLKDTTYRDQDLALSTPYCYKAFWLDTFGNVKDAVVSSPYPGTGPAAGSLTFSAYGPRSVTLSHTPSSSTSYASATLRRYGEIDCTAKSDTEGLPLGLTANIPSTVRDDAVPLLSGFCYKVVWRDAFGNTSSATASYPGPASGALNIASLSPQTIHLAHTVPTQSSYESVQLRRYQMGDCSASGQDTGDSLSLAKNTAALADSSLALSTAYCYKIFWTDKIGNVTTAVAKYGGVGPTAGSIAIASLGPQTIHLSHTPSTGTSYDHVVLRRYSSLTCDLELASGGTGVTLGKTDLAYADTGLSLGTPYCYKAFWYDAFGNVSSAHTPTSYDGQAPAAGSVAIASYGPQTIHLSHTPSASANYDRVALRRYNALSCSSEPATGGTGVTLEKNTTSLSDANLALAQAYCYKAFWYDAFGNFSSATSPSSYSGTGPTGGALSLSLGPQTSTLSHTPPTSANYSAVILREFTEGSCGSNLATEGTDVPLAATTTPSVSRTSLALATPYCYKIFWTDTFGNVTTATAAYNAVPPTAGSVAITSVAAQTLNLSITQSTDATVDSFDLRRHTSTSCASSDKASGTSLSGISKTSTSLSDTGLALQTAYCYKAYWLDRFGNASSATVPTPYDGATSPSGGSIAISGRASDTIVLGHTSPTSSFYSNVSLRRFDGITSCDDKLISEGTGVAMATNAISVSNTGLSPGQDYCYKIFWTDSFGNVRSASGGSARTPIQASSVPAPQVTWFQNASVNQTITPNFAPTGWSDAGAPSTKPSFLSLSSPSGTYPLTFSGTATTVGVSSWGLNFNSLSGDKNIAVTTRIINGSDNSYSTPSTIALADAATATLSGSASLDTRYDGSSVTFKYLAGDAGPTDTTSGSSMGSAVTDIPGLTYESATPASPGSLPYLVPTTGSYNAAIHSIAGGYQLYWNYGVFDQGEYFVKTIPYLNADGAALYGTAASTLVKTTDLGSEQTVTADTSINDGTYFGPTWDKYLPSMAIGRTTTTTDNIETYGVIYPAMIDTPKHFLGSITVDRTSPASPSFAKAFVDGGGNRYRVSALSVDATEMAISGLDTVPGWIMAGTEALPGNNTAQQLVLSRGSPGSTLDRLELVGAQPYSAKFGAVAMTPAVTDSDGVTRHGLAFYAQADNSGSRGVYLTKIRPNSSTFTSTNVFDQSAYYSSNDISQHAPSLLVSTSGTSSATMLRLAYGLESGVGVFYVGWRVGTTVSIARVKATPESSVPTSPTPLVSSSTLTSMGSLMPGQSSYTMATGETLSTTPVLAVFYASSAAPTKCQVTAYTYTAPSTLTRSNSVDLATSATQCLFPTIFFNRSAKRFLAVWVDESTKQTRYTSFTMTLTGGTLTMSSDPVVTITSGYEPPSAPGTTGDVCSLVASYTDSAQGQLGPRLATLRLDNDGSSGCGNDSGVYRFDTFKPRR